MKNFLKNIIFCVLNLFYGRLGNKAAILMYHSVGDNGAFFTVKEEEFERQLLYLKKKKFNVIKLSELINRISNKEDIGNCVSLTFDDGYYDNYKNVFPLILKYKLPVTIFLATIFVDVAMKNSEGIELKTLSLDQIKEMAESGLVEFMPHTRAHQKLTKLDPEIVREELIKSRQFIEKNLKINADILAYPYGKYNQQIVSLVKELNFRGSVTIENGLIDSESDIFRLKRNSVDSTTSFVQFIGKISRSIERYNSFLSFLRR